MRWNFSSFCFAPLVLIRLLFGSALLWIFLLDGSLNLCSFCAPEYIYIHAYGKNFSLPVSKRERELCNIKGSGLNNNNAWWWWWCWNFISLFHSLFRPVSAICAGSFHHNHNDHSKNHFSKLNAWPSSIFFDSFRGTHGALSYCSISQHISFYFLKKKSEDFLFLFIRQLLSSLLIIFFIFFIFFCYYIFICCLWWSCEHQKRIPNLLRISTVKISFYFSLRIFLIFLFFFGA